MSWMTGNWMNQSVPGLGNIYPTNYGQQASVPAAPAPQATPPVGDYWAQLSSLLGMPTQQQQSSPSSYYYDQAMQRNNMPFPQLGSVPYQAQMNWMQQAQQNAAMRQQQQQAPSNMYGNMPMMGNQPSQQFRPGSNQGRSNPMLRADGSVIDAASYVRGDRPGMPGRRDDVSTFLSANPQRPQLAPPTTAGRPSKTRGRSPSATFSNESGGISRQSLQNIPGFSNFAY